jgi:hypothetical protein
MDRPIGGTGSTTFYNLTTSATAAVTVSAATTVNNQLALNSKVTLSSAALTIGSAGLAISGTSSSNYIVATGSGILQKTFGSAGSYTYPIGDASNFTPIAATLAASSFGGTVGFTTTNSKNPQDASVTDYLNRYWTMTTSGLTSPSVSGTATFIPADIVGTAANVYSAVNNANTSSGWALGSAITSPTLAFSGVTTSGATFGGVNGVPPVVTSLVPSKHL